MRSIVDLQIFQPDFTRPCNLIPLAGSSVPAGFPSPADEHLDKKLDLNTYLVSHPMATFYVRARGESMIDAGIKNNSLLIVDRSVRPKDGHIVVALIDNEFTVKRLRIKGKQVSLQAENKDFAPIELKPGQQMEVWGVVTHVINTMI